MGDRDMKENQWVDARLGMLNRAPDWQPDSRTALAKLHGRRRASESRRKKLFWTSATVTAIGVGVLWMPVSGSCAPPPAACPQRLWQKVFLPQPVAVVAPPPAPPAAIAVPEPPAAPVTAPRRKAAPVRPRSVVKIVRDSKEV